MIQALVQKFSAPPPDFASIASKFEADITDAETSRSRAQDAHTDAILVQAAGGPAAPVETTRKAIEAADKRIADLRSSLGGVNDRRATLAAKDASRAAEEARAQLIAKRDAALALAADTDRLASELSVHVHRVVETRAQLIEKREQLARQLWDGLGGVQDMDGAACNVANFDSFLKIDMGAAGLFAFGPQWTDPRVDRPMTIAERVRAGTMLIESWLMKRVPS